MTSNLDRYKNDLEILIEKGQMLYIAIQADCFPKEIEAQFDKAYGNEGKVLFSALPSFEDEYQTWYSEAKVFLKQLLPDRLEDFVRHYEKPRNRKTISFENYKIEDYLQGLKLTRGWEKEKVVGPDAAIPQFKQQLAIVKAVRKRFESSLFDIHQLVQADLFDSELEVAAELLKNKFNRAAGAVAGVVLEGHLAQVCKNHSIKVTKKSPTISDLNNVLKEDDVIETPQWRFIQHLADIRNLCDHKKKVEPTEGQVSDLIAGVTKTTKTLF